jgi:mRNA-degrading endonuclease YafQ of YafQ-DinJ toxin-antitoxin module
MVESDAPTIRQLMTLCEGLTEAKNKKQAPEPQQQQPQKAGLQIRVSNQFVPSLERNRTIFPDLSEKLIKFIQVKMNDPLNGRFGKHDSPFASGTPLAGFKHCHLRDDAILIYTMAGGCLNLYYICPHKEIEGKMTKKTSGLLQSMTPAPVDTKALVNALS